jgi:hypothetical protein
LRGWLNREGWKTCTPCDVIKLMFFFI